MNANIFFGRPLNVFAHKLQNWSVLPVGASAYFIGLCLAIQTFGIRNKPKRLLYLFEPRERSEIGDKAEVLRGMKGFTAQLSDKKTTSFPLSTGPPGHFLYCKSKDTTNSLNLLTLPPN